MARLNNKEVLVVVFWRDIPAQVIARRGRDSARIELPVRFQEAIDKAAMRAGMAGTDEYLSQWRNESGAAAPGGDLQGAAEARARALEEAYDDARLQALVSSRGVAGQAAPSA